MVRSDLLTAQDLSDVLGDGHALPGRRSQSQLLSDPFVNFVGERCGVHRHFQVENDRGECGEKMIVNRDYESARLEVTLRKMCRAGF